MILKLVRILLGILFMVLAFIGSAVFMYYLGAALAWLVARLGPDPFGR